MFVAPFSHCLCTISESGLVHATFRQERIAINTVAYAMRDTSQKKHRLQAADVFGYSTFGMSEMNALEQQSEDTAAME